MDLNQKLDDIFGLISERTNEADAGHYKWRDTAGGRAKTNAQQRRKQGTRHGKNVDNAKHAAQRDVAAGVFTGGPKKGQKVPQKPTKCSKPGHENKGFIKSHINGHDKDNHHNWKWECTACHAAHDNNQKGDNTNKGSIRSPQNDKSSGKGNESGQRESVEAIAALLEAEYEPAPLEKKGQGAGDRFLAQPMKRIVRRGKTRKDENPRFSSTDNMRTLQVDANWNVTNDPDKVKYTINPFSLGISQARRSGTGDPLMYARTTISPNTSHYFVFSKPNYVEDNTITPQKDSYIPPQDILKRQHEIRAIIPKNPKEGFGLAKINITGDQVSYTEPEEIQQDTVRVAKFKPPFVNKGIERLGSPAAKEITPKPDRLINPKITMMSNDQIAQFLNPVRTVIGSGATQVGREEAKDEFKVKWKPSYNDAREDYLIHGAGEFLVHPDLTKAILHGRYGEDLKNFFKKESRAKGKKERGSKTTEVEQKLQQAAKDWFSSRELTNIGNKKGRVVVTDPQQNKWAVKTTNKTIEGQPARFARDLVQLVPKLGTGFHIGFYKRDWETYKKKAIERWLVYAHMHHQNRIQTPFEYKPVPPKFIVGKIQQVSEQMSDRGKFQLLVKYIDVETGESKTNVFPADKKIWPAVNVTKATNPEAPITKPNRRRKKRPPGVAESIARAEYRNILAISEDVHEDLVNPPTQGLSIEDISNLLD